MNNKMDLKSNFNKSFEPKFNQLALLENKTSDQEQQQLENKITKIFKGLTKIARSCYQLIYQICCQNFDNQV